MADGGSYRTDSATVAASGGGGGVHGTRDTTTDTRSRNWCFTINRRDEDGDDDWAGMMGYVRTVLRAVECWAIFEPEKGDSTHREHIQGYVAFKHARTLTGVKAVFGINYIHLEPAKGTLAQNKAYCSKEGTAVTVGEEPKGQGHRSDLHETAKALIATPTLDLLTLVQDGTVRNQQQLAFATSVKAMAATAATLRSAARKTIW